MWAALLGASAPGHKLCLAWFADYNREGRSAAGPVLELATRNFWRVQETRQQGRDSDVLALCTRLVCQLSPRVSHQG